MSLSHVRVRPAGPADLDAVNRVVEAALMTWNLPERVKRLSLPSYRYTEADQRHLEMVVAEDRQHTVIGVAAWEAADARDAPEGRSALLLHGIYVHPGHRRRGVGRRLFEAAQAAVRIHDCDGLLVKAQKDANGFFLALGMQPLEAVDASRDYTNRFWQPAAAPGNNRV
jgi:GNAT superfamily N-acetyltransferase